MLGSLALGSQAASDGANSGSGGSQGAALRGIAKHVHQEIDIEAVKNHQKSNVG
jgi:hypothetical protein